MIYRKVFDHDISLLGFGLMRLPRNEDNSINEELTEQMVDYAMEHGVNYYDTAWIYMDKRSEIVIGKILKKYPRDSYYLADKYPGHMPAASYDPEEIFEKQLEKCGVDYFDFYLLHNVYENSYANYVDPRWGIIDYFIEQKKKGRIKHLGFSSHGDLPVMKRFMDEYGEHMEFVQIQMNYLDWETQKVAEKYRYFEELGKPVIVMEPVRGGKLASLDDDTMAKLEGAGSRRSAASYAMRWMHPYGNLMTVLSGMSNMEQVIDNVAAFDHEDPLNDKEAKIIEETADAMGNFIPCTECRYCTSECPMELDIPDLLYKYNQLRSGVELTIKMQLDAYPEEKQPSACIACGSCVDICPQKIAIPDELKAFDTALGNILSWAEVSRRREEAAKKALAANGEE